MSQQKKANSQVTFDFARTPITQIADFIIISASKAGASDIHFDPREDGMMVRFRVDGDCQDYTFIPKAYERNLTTRLKLLANMNITESRLPQDGAIKGNFGGKYLDMRVSSLPVNEGEKVVIRILDYSRSLQGVDSLGFNPKNLEKLKRMMELPNGIILVTGATGSGKSTTTYSVLQGLNVPEVNVITVEDPIEMNIEGINQVQVNAEIGMTFAAALRSILRQDPNIILIGEIRDSETAQIAIRASITGHLVLSTIHTNNSLSTIERLLDMDVERYLLSTALSGIISQRLVKCICKDCRVKRETTQYEKKVFKKYMNQDVDEIWDTNKDGCPNCRKGYKGRIALQEVLELDDELRSAINNEHLQKEELSKLVYTSKTITLLQDALGKVLDGHTSFEEVYKAIEIENEDDVNYNPNEIDEKLKEAQLDDSNNNENDVDSENVTNEESNVESNIENNVINKSSLESVDTSVNLTIPIIDTSSNAQVNIENNNSSIPTINENSVPVENNAPYVSENVENLQKIQDKALENNGEIINNQVNEQTNISIPMIDTTNQINNLESNVEQINTGVEQLNSNITPAIENNISEINVENPILDNNSTMIPTIDISQNNYNLQKLSDEKIDSLPVVIS